MVTCPTLFIHCIWNRFLWRPTNSLEHFKVQAPTTQLHQPEHPADFFSSCHQPDGENGWVYKTTTVLLYQKAEYKVVNVLLLAGVQCCLYQLEATTTCYISSPQQVE